jgi:pyruvate formate lyase activating enzyme
MANNESSRQTRRGFIKQCVIGGCGLALGARAGQNIFRVQAAASSRTGDSLGAAVGDLESVANAAPGNLPRLAREADWFNLETPAIVSRVACMLCPQGCVLEEGERGKCRTRLAQNGKLYTVAYGNPCSVHIDPVEKKPLNHFLPGTQTFSIATAGCNLSCLNCQNWEISQARPEDTENIDLPPAAVVEETLKQHAPSISYTYSDPVVFYEYAYDTAVLARKQGIRNVMVTAGYINPEPLRKLCKVIDAAHIDLKCFSDSFYKTVSKATLEPVLKTLQILREENVWFEVIRLLVPTLSDNMEEIRNMVRWIRDTLGPGTPLHLSRFYPAHKLLQLPPTPIETMRQAEQLAHDEGLHFVYVGNVPGYEGQDTICPHCKKVVVRRRGYSVLSNILKDGKCTCGEAIPGVWS